MPNNENFIIIVFLITFLLICILYLMTKSLNKLNSQNEHACYRFYPSLHREWVKEIFCNIISLVFKVPI